MKRMLDINKKIKKYHKKPENNFKFSLPKSKSNKYKQISIFLTYIAAIITIALIYFLLSFKVDTKTNTPNLDQTTETKNTVNQTITMYINSKDEQDLSLIKKQLNQTNLNANLVFSSNIDKDVIYFSKEQATIALKITEALKRDFELKESVSTIATGIVVYYKK